MSDPIRFWIVTGALNSSSLEFPSIHYGQEPPNLKNAIDGLIEDNEMSGEWAREFRMLAPHLAKNTFARVTGPFEVPGGARFPHDWHPVGVWEEGLPTEEGHWWIYTQDTKHPNLSRIRLGKAALSGSNTLMISEDGSFIYASEWSGFKLFHMPAILPEPPISPIE